MNNPFEGPWKENKQKQIKKSTFARRNRSGISSEGFSEGHRPPGLRSRLFYQSFILIFCSFSIRLSSSLQSPCSPLLTKSHPQCFIIKAYGLRPQWHHRDNELFYSVTVIRWTNREEENQWSPLTCCLWVYGQADAAEFSFHECRPCFVLFQSYIYVFHENYVHLWYIY